MTNWLEVQRSGLVLQSAWFFNLIELYTPPTTGLNHPQTSTNCRLGADSEMKEGRLRVKWSKANGRMDEWRIAERGMRGTVEETSDVFFWPCWM
jgi:hypothetical protein